jgi:hypothetical protein
LEIVNDKLLKGKPQFQHGFLPKKLNLASDSDLKLDTPAIPRKQASKHVRESEP